MAITPMVGLRMGHAHGYGNPALRRLYRGHTRRHGGGVTTTYRRGRGLHCGGFHDQAKGGMMHVKGYLFCFMLGLAVGAGVCGAIVYRSSLDRIGQLGGELEQAIRDNQRLGDKLAHAEVVVGKLGAELDRSSGFISRAKSELESSKSSVAKIRAILEALRDLESCTGGTGGGGVNP